MMLVSAVPERNSLRQVMGRRVVTSPPSARWQTMTKTRRTLAGFALATLLLGPVSAQAAAEPKDDTPIQSHIKMPLSGLFTDHGIPVDWSILGTRL
ncbi:hypothetical protein ACFVT2_12670 [Streptomyces sp. NPDC058000]|uniref:hypothetical protein n=1 Tax=Streptomyces sp. NPDC058000 TaxID=3346299 RepID=UPI0036F0A971